jgi:hypothetical protein
MNRRMRSFCRAPLAATHAAIQINGLHTQHTEAYGLADKQYAPSSGTKLLRASIVYQLLAAAAACCDRHHGARARSCWEADEQRHGYTQRRKKHALAEHARTHNGKRRRG